jgi:hypothetical protein
MMDCTGLWELRSSLRSRWWLWWPDFWRSAESPVEANVSEKYTVSIFRTESRLNIAANCISAPALAVCLHPADVSQLISLKVLKSSCSEANGRSASQFTALVWTPKVQYVVQKTRLSPLPKPFVTFVTRRLFYGENLSFPGPNHTSWRTTPCRLPSPSATSERAMSWWQTTRMRR